MKKFTLISLILIASLLLGGCAAPAATQAPTEAAPVPPSQPSATTAPTTPPEPAPTTQAASPGEQKLLLATTTSTQDSGLLDYLLPDFEKEFNVEVDVVAVGTGQAIQLGKDGNADVLLVHARSQEDQFMSEGHGVRREDVMYNDFVILGPEEDPAGIKGSASAADAFKKIAELGQTPFVSRGDESGTHSKEKSIWKTAAIEPAGSWYVSAGQGMGEVLTMSAEQQAYTLSDRATYLARSKQGLDLVVLVEGDKALFNPYGVIAVNPDKGPQIHLDLANQFIDWIISVPVQEKIGAFGKEEFGQSLFTPSSTLWNEANPSATAAEAALKVTGSVDQEMSWSEEEVRGMETIDIESTNKQGEKSTYTGVLLSALLEQAKPSADATTVVFVAGDGFTAEIALADLMGCADCILSFRNQGGFSSVLPGQPGSLQVKDVIEIQVK